MPGVVLSQYSYVNILSVASLFPDLSEEELIVQTLYIIVVVVVIYYYFGGLRLTEAAWS